MRQAARDLSANYYEADTVSGERTCGSGLAEGSRLPGVEAAFAAFVRLERELVTLLESRIGEDETLLAEIRPS